MQEGARQYGSGVGAHGCDLAAILLNGLREYGVEPSIWDGDPSCSHEWGKPTRTAWANNVPGEANGRGGKNADYRNTAKETGPFCAKCGAWRGVLGMEPDWRMYVEHLVEVFREVRRVLRDDGTCWLNLGDSYATGAGLVGDHPGGGAQGSAWAGRPPAGSTAWAGHGVDRRGRGTRDAEAAGKHEYTGIGPMTQPNRMPQHGMKPKDLMLIPSRVAIALCDDGWWVRSDIAWCLSGGTWLYARTADTPAAPMMLKDLVRLKPETVELWNGERWTRVTAWTNRRGRDGAKEIVLRSGERVGCTDDHLWPTARGNVRTFDLRVGDIVSSTRLPTGSTPAGWLTEDAFWFAGLFLAEGNYADRPNRLQIAGHVDEHFIANKIRDLVEHYGGSMRVYNYRGKARHIHIDSIGLTAVVKSLIAGRISKDKHIAPGAWRYRDWALDAVMRGYLDGDGHDDRANNRYRLGFCRNYALERDLRALAARLGATLTLRPSFAKDQSGKKFPSFKGEWRWTRSGHHAERDRGEVMEIRNSRARQFWDVTVADHPHLFALASGVLTHNCKANPMPESVTDRPTKSWEHVFLLAKSERYYYDAEAIAEPVAPASISRMNQDIENQIGSDRVPGKTNGPMKAVVKRSGNKQRKDATERGAPAGTGKNQAGSVPWEGATRNKRDVWPVNTAGFGGEFCRACRTYFEGDALAALRVEKVMEDGRERRRRWCGCGEHDKWLSHFATFPGALIEPMIKAGTSERGCCAKCGSPWERITERLDQGWDGSRYGEAALEATGGAKTGGRSTLGSNNGKLVGQRETQGWRPTCKYRELHCESCEFVLDKNHENGASTTNENVRDVPNRLPSQDASIPILQPQVLLSATEQDRGQNVPSVPKEVQTGLESNSVLQQTMLGEMDSSTPERLQEGAHYQQPGVRADPDAEPSQRAEVRLHHGASYRDGEETGAPSSQDGDRSSHQRQEAGQPTQKPRTDQKQQRARKTPKADVLRDLSEVSACISDEGQCPRCRGRLVWRTAQTKPAVVLDCFGGAGTTGLVADRLGRDAVLLELNPEYAEMIRQRIAGDGGMFAAVSLEPGMAITGPAAGPLDGGKIVGEAAE